MKIQICIFVMFGVLSSPVKKIFSLIYMKYLLLTLSYCWLFKTQFILRCYQFY